MVEGEDAPLFNGPLPGATVQWACRGVVEVGILAPQLALQSWKGVTSGWSCLGQENKLPGPRQAREGGESLVWSMLTLKTSERL